jgi:hypothetical protein
MVFRPRTATEIVDATFRICRAHYGPFITVMLVIGAPALLLGLFPSTVWLGDLTQNILFTVADGAVIAIVSEVYLGRRAGAGVGLRAVRGRVGALVVASILRNLLVVLGLILLIVPGLFMIASTFAIPMLIVVEGRTIGASFTQSQKLVEANLWHVARTLALLGAIVVGLFLGLAAVLGITVELLWGAERFVDTILNVAMTLLYPLFSVGATLLYYDLRIRTEGFDLEIMLANMGAESSGTSADAAVPPVI